MANLKLSHIYKVYDNGHKAVNLPLFPPILILFGFNSKFIIDPFSVL